MAMEIIKAEGREDYDIVVHGKNICPDCGNRYHCRQARKDVTDCEHFIQKQE